MRITALNILKYESSDIVYEYHLERNVFLRWHKKSLPMQCEQAQFSSTSSYTVSVLLVSSLLQPSAGKGSRKQSLGSTWEAEPYTWEASVHHTRVRLLPKYQDQYQVLSLRAPRFQRTEEEEKGFILGEKVLELACRSGTLATQSNTSDGPQCQHHLEA